MYLGLVLTTMFVTVHQGSEHLEKFLQVSWGLLLVLMLAPAAVPSAFPAVPRAVLSLLVNGDRTGLRFGGSPDVTRNAPGYAAGLAVWLAGMVLGVAIVVGAVAADWRLARLPGWQAGPLDIWFGSFVVLYVALNIPPVYRIVSPPVAICALLGLLAAVYAVFSVAFEHIPFLEGHSDLARLVTFLLLAILFSAVNNGPYKLRFPKMAMYYPGTRHDPVDLRARVRQVYDTGAGHAPQPGNHGEAELVADSVVLDHWVSQVTNRSAEEVAAGPPEQRPKLAIVTVSGGATRSGFWSAVVLDRIEKRIPTFGKHVRIIAGASGGMLGAGHYLIHRIDPDPPDDRSIAGNEGIFFTLLTSIARAVSPLLLRSVSLVAGQQAAGAVADIAIGVGKVFFQGPRGWVHRIPRRSIDPVARFIALRDPWLAWLPLPITDRGIALENDWEKLGLAFQDLLAWERDGKIPSMILSPMIVDDGRRLLISNLDLWELAWEQGSALAYNSDGTDRQPYSLSALEFFRLFPKATGFRLATGVRMSASFPYVSPSVNLPCNPPRRVVDAGYYDNYGVQIAAAWIRKNHDWLVRHTSGVVLVQIRDSISQKDRMEIADAPRGVRAWLARGFQFFTSPVEGVASARNSSTIFRNDQDVGELCAQFNTDSRLPGFFTTVGIENSATVTFDRRNPHAWPETTGPLDVTSGDVPLDWYLSLAESASLMCAIPADPPPDSQWHDPEVRLQNIVALQQKADTASGPERDAWLKRLEQAKNYERLVRLEDWWGGCHVRACACSHDAPVEAVPDGQGH